MVRDYAFHDNPLQPPATIFPIVAVYMWFLYAQVQIRNLRRYHVVKIPLYNNAPEKLKPDDYEYKTFDDLELVYLVHFNWVSVKDLCAWDEALDSLGRGLRWLYLHGAERRVEIKPGAVRYEKGSPFVQECFKRFGCSASILDKARTVSEGEWEGKEEHPRESYLNFGKTISIQFRRDSERAVLPALYEYLCGRGKEPEMSQKMKDFFKPILHCHGGGVGGMGTPYEQPWAVDDTTPRPSAADEVEQLMSVQTEPFKLLALEAQLKAAREEIERYTREEEEAERELKEAKEAMVKKVSRKKKGNGWSKRRPQKSKAPVKVKSESELDVAQCLGDEVDKEPEIPIKKEAEVKMPSRILTRFAMTAISKEKATVKGKGKAPELPTSETVTTGSKRRRDEDEDYNAANDENIAIAEPSRPREKRGSRKKTVSCEEVMQASVDAEKARQNQPRTKVYRPPTRFSKRLRSIKSESLNERVMVLGGQEKVNSRASRSGRSKAIDGTVEQLDPIGEEIEPVRETRVNAIASTSSLPKEDISTVPPPTVEEASTVEDTEMDEVEMSLVVDDGEIKPEIASDGTPTPPLSPQAAVAIAQHRPLRRQETYMVDGPVPMECITTKHIS